MDALKKALADLEAAEASYHNLLDPEAHLATCSRVLAVATARTLLGLVDGSIKPTPPASDPEPVAAAPDQAPAAAVPQDAKPAAAAPDPEPTLEDKTGS